MREYLLWSLDKESVGHPFRLVKRDGKRFGFGFASQLPRRIPIGHPGIEWVENNVAAVRIVELLDEFAGWVINDCAVTSCLHLVEHLANDAGLPGAGVPNDQKMLVLCIPRYPER